MTLIASSQLTIILGLGLTGLSVVRFLARQQIKFIVMDSRQNPPGLDSLRKEFANVKYIVGKLDEELLSIASEIIVSPGLDLKTPEIAAAIKSGVSVIGDIELFARELNKSEENKSVVAITGSNAKTTVTSLVGQMVKDAGINVAVGGNIGKPVLELLQENAELYVLELSSFQLESTFSLKSTVSTVLNISEDHMDRYANLAEYHRAKQKIYFGAQTVVFNRADVLTQPPLAQGVNRISFGLDRPDRCGFGIIVKENKQYLAYEFSVLMPIEELQLRGSHNTSNCLAALAIGSAIKIPFNSMLDTLKNFKGLEHRCQWVATINGVEYINDSKATNVGATVAAIKGFSDSAKTTVDKTNATKFTATTITANTKDKNIILIAGGQSKGADFSPLVKSFANNVSMIILLGEDAKLIESAIFNSGLETPIKVLHVDSLNAAVNVAKANAKPDDIVLLSPACASFDMFKNYEDRGRQFIKIVEALVA
jgi:UDP-N-acetylmuramoylalanine--D-glutamate ligase